MRNQTRNEEGQPTDNGNNGNDDDGNDDDKERQ